MMKNRREGQCGHCGHLVHRFEGFFVRGGVQHGYGGCAEAARAAWIRLHGH